MGIGFSIYGRPWYGYYTGYRVGYASPGYSTVVVDSSQPIVETPPEVAPNEVAPNEVAPNEAAPLAEPNAVDSQFRRDAEVAFRAGDFEQAARLASHALIDAPNDGRLHLLTSQALFALGDYEGAAAGIHQAASLLPPNEWGHIVEHYQDYYQGSAYVDQMNKLTDFIKENPDSAYAYFVRGYHNGFLGHQEAAIKDLTKARELENRDELAGQLIERFGGSASTEVEPALLLPNPNGAKP